MGWGLLIGFVVGALVFTRLTWWFIGERVETMERQLADANAGAADLGDALALAQQELREYRAKRSAGSKQAWVTRKAKQGVGNG